MTATAHSGAAALPVRRGEKRWTEAEISALRDQLAAEVAALRTDIGRAEAFSMPVLLLLLLVLALGYLLYRLPRRQEPALLLERALFRTLAARGLPRAPSDTYEEALGKIRGRDAALARETEPILARLAAARFGGRGLDAAEAEALRSRIQRLG